MYKKILFTAFPVVLLVLSGFFYTAGAFGFSITAMLCGVLCFLVIAGHEMMKEDRKNGNEGKY